MFDGVNGLLYLGRGQNTNATASLAAMIPLVGTGLKYGIKGVGKVAVKGGERLLLNASKFPRLDFKFGKHAAEWSQWGSISKTAYYNRAISLAESQVEGKIMGFTSKQVGHLGLIALLESF